MYEEAFMKTIKISDVHYVILKEIMKRRKVRKEDECLEEILQEIYHKKK